MADPTGTPDRRAQEPSAPPTEPSVRDSTATDVGPGRLTALFALLLIFVIVAIPLFLWRRPTTLAEELPAAAVAVDAGSTTVEIDGSMAATPAATAADVDAAPPIATPPGVTLSDAKVVECHDPGPRRTSPSDCDHLPSVERALAKIVADNAACVPSTAGSGALPFLFDISYQRKKQPVSVSLPRDGRTLKSAKAVAACASAVRKALASAPALDTTHQHSRYKVQITATFSGSPTTP